MGSADWMPRNLDKRVEILFPVEDERCKEEVIHILDVQLADTCKAHLLMAEGNYEKVDRRGKVSLIAQECFVEEAKAKVKVEQDVTHDRVFIPKEPVRDEEDDE